MTEKFTLNKGEPPVSEPLTYKATSDRSTALVSKQAAEMVEGVAYKTLFRGGEVLPDLRGALPAHMVHYQISSSSPDSYEAYRATLEYLLGIVNNTGQASPEPEMEVFVGKYRRLRHYDTASHKTRARISARQKKALR